MKQDNVVHRCLEGIKAQNDSCEDSAKAAKFLHWQVESQMDFSLFRESRAQEEVQVGDEWDVGTKVSLVGCRNLICTCITRPMVVHG